MTRVLGFTVRCVAKSFPFKLNDKRLRLQSIPFKLISLFRVPKTEDNGILSFLAYASRRQKPMVETRVLFRYIVWCMQIANANLSS